MIRIETKTFLQLLGDLVHTATATGTSAGVLLHSARGHADPTEPGVSDLLAGTSSTGRLVGHTWCAAGGQLPPMLWRLGDVQAVITVFNALAKGQKEHTLDIRRDLDEITVAEDPNLFGETSLTFAAAPLDDYPRDLWRAMDGYILNAVVDVGTDPAPRTDLDPHALAALAKVAKRRCVPIRTYRVHQSRRMLLQIGDTWRGALMPSVWDRTAGEIGDAPDSDMYPPMLPDPDTEAAS